jgi:methyl-accepting chemotaxis protein
MWSMRTTVMATFVILSLAAVFTQPAGFCQSEMKKGSSAQDLLIKNEVETAISMLQTISAKQQKGELTLEQAKQLGADLLRGLRYGKDGYFWAAKDVKGKPYIRDFIAKAKAGGGYLNYWFPKLNQTTPLPKRSYVQLFESFGWVVGSGYYLPTSKVTKE